MLTALPLYPHQEEALDALTGQERELISFPTGGGKGVMIAHAALRAVTAQPDERVLVGVHTQELVDQLYKTIKDVAPGLDVGIVKAQEHDDVTARVIVFSMQTLRREARRAAIKNVGTLIWDEAHHATSPSYRVITEHFAGARLLGFTATPERGDGQSLGGVWDRVAFSRDVSWMVRHRWLIPPRGKAVEVPDLDLSKVTRTAGDYREGALGAALADSLAPGVVAAAWLEHAADRKTIAFFPTVASCYTFAEAFQDLGVDARVVHGALPDDERRQLLADHRAGVFPVLVNCMMLTEGYDDPTIRCVLIGRPTRSRPLHMQIVGRGLRVDPALPYEGQDCLLLYVVGRAPIPELRTMADLSDRPVVARDGATLTELEDEFDSGPGVAPDGPVFYSGEVISRDFDPLARKSSRVWIKTNGGSYFVPAGKHGYVFIFEYPEPGRWSVAWCTTYPSGSLLAGMDGIPRPAARPAGRSVGMTAHRGLPLDQAMVWAEDLAVDMGTDTMNLANKRASWRRGRPSDKTVALAATLGIETDERNAGKLSDLIGIVLGSQRIDPLVAKVRAQK